MVLAEQWQCSLHANVPSVQSSVPTMFLQCFAHRRVTNRRVLPFPNVFPCEQKIDVINIWFINVKLERNANAFGRELFWDAAFLLTVGSFLPTVELFYLQLTILAFYLQLKLFCLQWESASTKGLKGL